MAGDDYMDFQKQYEVGLPVFTALFEMKKPELMEKLKTICQGTRVPDHVLNSGEVHKHSRNDKPEYIEVWFYDHIRITPFGINYKPEHGEGEHIINFNEHFKL